jgi:hypothetical protein
VKFVFIDIRAADLPAPHAVPYRPACPAMATAGYIGRYVKSDSTTSLRWVCDHCGTYLPGDLPRALIGDTPIELLPIADRRPLREDDDAWPSCVVCEQPGFEFHHWAPRSLFPDWPEHIGAPLCKPHHDEWHERLRAHGLRWPHELEAA